MTLSAARPLPEKRFGGEAKAQAAATKLNEWLENERRSEAWKDGRPTVTSLVPHADASLAELL
jgi:hypothetical protein